MQKLKKILNPGSSKDDEVMYSDANPGKIAGEGAHFSGKDKPSRGFSRRSKSSKSTSPAPAEAASSSKPAPAGLDAKNPTASAAAPAASAAPTEAAGVHSSTESAPTKNVEKQEFTTGPASTAPLAGALTASGQKERATSDVSGSVYSQDASAPPATNTRDSSATHNAALGAGAGAGALGAAGMATGQSENHSAAPLSSSGEMPGRSLSQEEQEIQDATFTYRSYQLASPSKPANTRQDSMPAVPGRFPSTDGLEAQTQGSQPYAGSTVAVPPAAGSPILEEPSTPTRASQTLPTTAAAQTPTQPPVTSNKQDESHVGRNAALAGGVGAAGATAYGLAQSRDQGVSKAPSAPIAQSSSVADQTESTPSAFTSQPPKGDLPQAPVTPTKQTTTTAPIISKSTPSQPATSTTMTKPVEVVASKGSTPAKSEDEHHYGRNALFAGGAGAAAAGLYRAVKGDEKAEPVQQTQQPTASSIPASTQSSESNVPSHAPSKRGGFFSGPQGTAIGNSPSTTASAYSEQRATPHVPHKDGTQDAAAAGAGGYLGTGSFEQPEKFSAGSQSGAAQPSRDESHTGRNAALAGGAGAATTAAAYGLHERDNGHVPAPATSQSVPQASSQAPVGSVTHSPAAPVKQSTQTSAHPAQSSQVASQEAPLHSTKDESHAGRNAALAGGAVAATGAGAYALHERKADTPHTMQQTQTTQPSQSSRGIAHHQGVDNPSAGPVTGSNAMKTDHTTPVTSTTAPLTSSTAPLTSNTAPVTSSAAPAMASTTHNPATAPKTTAGHDSTITTEKSKQEDSHAGRNTALAGGAAVAGGAFAAHELSQRDREKLEQEKAHEAERAEKEHQKEVARQEQEAKHKADEETKAAKKQAEKDEKAAKKQAEKDEKEAKKKAEKEEKAAKKQAEKDEKHAKKQHEKEVAAAAAAAEVEKKRQEKEAQKEEERKLKEQQKEEEHQRKLAEKEDKRKSKEVEREESKADKKRQQQEEAAALAAAEAERKHHAEEIKRAEDERAAKLHAEKEERERQEKLQKEQEREAEKEEKSKKRRSVFGFLHRDKDEKSRSPSTERRRDETTDKDGHKKEAAAGAAGVAGVGAAAYALHDRDGERTTAATDPSKLSTAGPTTAQNPAASSARDTTALGGSQGTSAVPASTGDAGGNAHATATQHQHIGTDGPIGNQTGVTGAAPNAHTTATQYQHVGTNGPIGNHTAVAGAAPGTAVSDYTSPTRATTGSETSPNQVGNDKQHSKAPLAAGAAGTAAVAGGAYAATRGRDETARDSLADQTTNQTATGRPTQTATTAAPTHSDKVHDKNDKHAKHADDDKEEKSKKRRSLLGFLHRDKSKDRDEKSSDRERSKSRPREPAIAAVPEEKTSRHDKHDKSEAGKVDKTDFAPAAVSDERARTPERTAAKSAHGSSSEGNNDGVGRHHSKLHKEPPKKVKEELEQKAEEIRRRSYEEHGGRHMGVDGEIGRAQ
ncbi:hypothetical protein CAC42_7618 [Sphaceloma murrayae]|uniref:Uncharacterized protein n=1 Tax=Sphaceloma murrayae TaxID=2082308 RepID=A0A2K1QTB5_9PEZI|nr:hypothetical protein CAC42_7618 [Sphaceloma murrayae]